MKTIKTIPKFGDVSWDVVKIQEQLFGDENMGKDITGIFDRYTEGRIILFQKQNNIETNYPGALGPLTLKLLGIEVVAFNTVKQKKTITSDLIGKKDRHLHPNLRVLLESYLFPDGKVLDCFKQRDLTLCAIAIFNALAKIDVIESGGNNRGQRVGEVQGTTGLFVKGGNGDDWCLDEMQVAIAFMEDYFKVESPIPPTASTIKCWNESDKILGLTSKEFEIGTICIAQRSPTAGHAMGVISEAAWDLMNTVEGNVDGRSGLYVRSKWLNGDLQTLGFIRFYPYNKLF